MTPARFIDILYAPIGGSAQSGKQIAKSREVFGQVKQSIRVHGKAQLGNRVLKASSQEVTRKNQTPSSRWLTAPISRLEMSKTNGTRE